MVQQLRARHVETFIIEMMGENKMLKKKIIGTIILMLLLTTILPVSQAINASPHEEKIENLSTSSDSWITIVHPKDGSRHFGAVLLSCKASSDVDFIIYNYRMESGYSNGFGTMCKKPFYLKLWTTPRIYGGWAKIAVYAYGHTYDYDENGRICGSHKVADSPEITIYRRF
jgi:hypothetical protein